MLTGGRFAFVVVVVVVDYSTTTTTTITTTTTTTTIADKLAKAAITTRRSEVKPRKVRLQRQNGGGSGALRPAHTPPFLGNPVRGCRPDGRVRVADRPSGIGSIAYQEYCGSENTIQCTASAMTSTANRIGISQVAGFRTSQTFQSSSGFFGRAICCSAMVKPS